MYCPNCSAKNKKKQNFCRYCGLHLVEIEKTFAGQLVFGDETKRLRNLRNVRRITDFAQMFSCVVAFIGISFIFFDASFGKLLVTAGLLSFFMAQAIRSVNGYLQRNSPRRHVGTPGTSDAAPDRITGVTDTTRLIEDRAFTPVSSITEETTSRLLTRPSRTDG